MDTLTNDTRAIAKHTIPFEFTGNAREYFSIWIVNVLLTILTLGIYSPWAKVRTLQYFYGNTRLGDTGFRYLASPVKILKGRVIALVFFAAYYFSGLISPFATGVTILIIALLIPAMVVMSMSFQLRNTSHRNIKFNFQIKNSAASDRVLRTQRLYRFAMKKLETLYIYAHHRDIPRAG